MENTITKLNDCRLCRSNSFHLLFLKEGYEVVKCSNCNLVFLNFAPTEKFITDYYAEDFFNDSGTKHGFSNYKKEADNIKKTFRERTVLLKKYKNSGTLLDIGCAMGTFMEMAAESWDVYGIEISSYASKIAKEKKLKVFNGRLQNAPYINSKFDIVTLWDTIEHLNDPLETVQFIGKMLKPGGIIALTTPDVGSAVARISGKYWHLYNIPQHLSYFSKNTIGDLLNKGGFKVKEISYPGVYFSMDYLLFRLTTFYKLKLFFNIYKNLSRKDLFDACLKINLYDIMLVIAQKNEK